MDATVLLKVLKSRWKGGGEYGEASAMCPSIGSPFCCSTPVLLAEKPSLELCKSLIMLRDYNISGKINLIDVPALMHTLHFWRVSFLSRCVCLCRLRFSIIEIVVTNRARQQTAMAPTPYPINL